MANFNININKKLYEAVIGETVSKGDILYLGTDHKWHLAAAGLKSKSTTELAIALDDGVENDEIDLLAYGYHTYTNSLFLPGTKYYLSIVSGKSTADRYENNDYTLRYVGTAFSDKILLFNPDQTYISDRGTRVNDIEFGGGGGGIVFTTDESLYLDPITNELRANLTTTIDTFDYLSGAQEFTLTETPVRMLYVWVQGVGLVKKNVQYEVDEVNKKLTILDELEGGEVITACYHNVINESITPFVTDVQVENKDLDVFKNESADPFVRESGIPTSGVQSVTGDGVSGTPEDVVMTFPTPIEIGAEEDLGTPDEDGQVLTSTTAGVRSWADLHQLTSFTTQLIGTGGNYNDLEVTADLLVFTNENAQAILNGVWGRKEFHILNLSSQYEILINHDSSSVTGNGQPIMLPTNSGTAGIKGTARILQTDSYGYFVADTWGSKYRPEFSELTEDKVMLVGADHRAKAEDIIELKFYRTNQSTAMDSAELENEYPNSIQGTEVICTPINKKYEKINNLGDWIEIDFATI